LTEVLTGTLHSAVLSSLRILSWTLFNHHKVSAFFISKQKEEKEMKKEKKKD